MCAIWRRPRLGRGGVGAGRGAALARTRPSGRLDRRYARACRGPPGCLPGQYRPPRLHPGRPERQPSASPASSRTDAQATIAPRRRLPCWAPRVRPRPGRLGRDLARPPCAWQPRLRHSRYSFRPSRRRSGMGSVRSVLTVFPLHLVLPRAVFSLVRTASCPCGPATCRQRYGAFESALVVHRRLK